MLVPFKLQYQVTISCFPSFLVVDILVASPITSILVSVQVNLFLVGWEFIWMLRTIRLYCHSRSKIILRILYNAAQSGYFISALVFSCVIISLGLFPPTFDGFTDKSREISLFACHWRICCILSGAWCFNAFENVEYLAVLFTSPVDIMIIYLQSMHVGVEIVYLRVIRRLRS